MLHLSCQLRARVLLFVTKGITLKSALPIGAQRLQQMLLEIQRLFIYNGITFGSRVKLCKNLAELGAGLGNPARDWSEHYLDVMDYMENELHKFIENIIAGDRVNS